MYLYIYVYLDLSICTFVHLCQEITSYVSIYIYTHTCTHTHTNTHTYTYLSIHTAQHGVATMSMLLKMTGLFCQRAL